MLRLLLQWLVSEELTFDDLGVQTNVSQSLMIPILSLFKFV